jgi:hypothetical protein
MALIQCGLHDIVITEITVRERLHKKIEVLKGGFLLSVVFE